MSKISKTNQEGPDTILEKLKEKLVILIKEKRIRVGMKQSELGKLTGACQSSVAKLEHYTNRNSLELILKCLYALEIEICFSSNHGSRFLGKFGSKK